MIDTEPFTFVTGSDQHRLFDDFQDLKSAKTAEHEWNGEDFVVYIIVSAYSSFQYVLKEPKLGKNTLWNSKATDALTKAVGEWQYAQIDAIYVYDNFWTRSRELWSEVQKATWDNVSLAADIEKKLTEVSERVFNSKDVLAGNEKTISIEALMHTLYDCKDPILTLYVKSAPATFHIRNVFIMARSMSPCLPVFEDIDTIVTSKTRSYFFNEMNGLGKNDGILMRVLFMPSSEDKLKGKRFITFPKKLCGAIAGITQGFSFAYMQEAFVATLLVIARHHVDTHGDKACDDGGGGNVGGNDDDLDDYEFWRIMKEQVKIPRSDMGTAILVCSDTELETEDSSFARLAGAGKSTVWSLLHARGCPPADLWNGYRAHVVDRGDRSTAYELSAALPVNRVALVNSAAFQYEWTV
ncbi:hypothetical protein B0A49_08269 [Cryomyces minteri]|uniref:Uncharacterized protein n=1 Tax=Cryomyces minteri TaxID=331657 RepID=A0A4V5NED7_9PEZI|nr:hypothetical protein B0A49_08269 [Cryomyces minteri]